MDIDTHTDLETKAGIPLDAMVTHGEMMRAFEAFKDANDERLALGEKRSGDVVLEEKLARLNSTLDAQASPCCAIPIPPSPTCCSTPPSAWAAAYRTSTHQGDEVCGELSSTFPLPALAGRGESSRNIN